MANVARRLAARTASRAVGTLPMPTPVHSSYTTPLSSAYPSTCVSEDELEPDHMVARIPVRSLTLEDFDKGSSKSKKAAQMPFPFLELPSELRIKVYGFYFAETGDIDLDPDNYKKVCKKLAILCTCRMIFAETSHFFFSSRTFRIFPTHGRYLKTKKPLLARLAPHQRECITSLELRLGPGFNNPPRSWAVNPALGLSDCVHVRMLKVFVECDPSDGFFNGFRRADGFYEEFSSALLNNVLKELPSVERVSFDAYNGVNKSGAMMQALLEVVADQGKTIQWGPERGWTNTGDNGEAKVTSLGLGRLSATGQSVTVVA